MPRKETNLQYQKQTGEGWKFSGFVLPTTTPVPDQFFDELLPRLSGAEVKVLLYICRRTFGFKKNADNISLKQMVRGIRTKAGKALDRGTGLGKASVTRALNSLEKKNIILRTRRRSDRKGDRATTYSLNILTPVSQNETPLVSKRDTPVSHQRDTQQTVLQQTDKQQQVVEKIIRFQLGRKKAQDLAAAYAPALIEEKIELLEWKLKLQDDGKARGRPIEDPAAWLVRAIEKDYQPPPGFKTRAQREEEAAERKKRRDERARQEAERVQRQRKQSKQEQRQQAQRLAALIKRHGAGERERELWRRVLKTIEDRANGGSKALFRAMLTNSALLKIEDGNALIVLRNRFARDWVEKNQTQLIRRLLAKYVHGQRVVLRFRTLDSPDG
jgi:hypothetical protein